MKKLLTIIFICFTLCSFSQEKEPNVEIRKNAFYFELGGNGGYSVNYDRIVLRITSPLFSIDYL